MMNRQLFVSSFYYFSFGFAFTGKAVLRCAA